MSRESAQFNDAICHRAPRGAATILVVDDQPCLCEVLATLLRRCGYEVLTATNGRQARDIAREPREIDLLLAATEIPDLRGPDSIGWFRAAQPRAEVIFTANDHPAIWPYAVELFERPFIYMDALLHRVRDAIERHQALADANLAAA